jgi:CBS domain containing-hemolysin-like protein
VIIALCIVVEGFFSGSEIAMVSVNRSHLRHLVAKGSRRAQALTRVLEKPEWILSTTLVGTNLSVVTLNAVATLYVAREFGSRWELATILVTAPLILVFGEVIPKTLFQRYADRIAVSLVYPLELVAIAMSPLVGLVAGVAKLVANAAGVHPTKKTPLLTREELELIFQASERHQGIKDLERKMIDRIFAFSDRRAREIMIPLVEVVSLRDDTTLEKAMETMEKSKYSKIPVYSGRSYNMVGWINHFDLLFSEKRGGKVGEYVRPLRFVPSTTRLDRLLVTMQREGDPLAVVVDEYGGAIGLVTMEDVLEEIVGEIEDEYDTQSAHVRRIDANRLVVDARAPISQLNDLLTHKVPPGDYETLGGFLATRLQRIPAKGDEVLHRNLLFRVRAATDRAVEEVEIVIRKE